MTEKLIVLPLVAIYYALFITAILAMLIGAVREFIRRKRQRQSRRTLLTFAEM